MLELKELDLPERVIIEIIDDVEDKLFDLYFQKLKKLKHII